MYLRRTPPHSGLTGVLGGEDGVYYHLGPEQYSFVNSMYSGMAVLSATTIYSGKTDLSTMFTNAPQIRVQGGVNTYTGGTLNLPTINVVDNPSFVSVSSMEFLSGSTDITTIIRNEARKLSIREISQKGEYFVDIDDCVLLCNLSSGPIDIVLTDSNNKVGRFFIIKDTVGLSDVKSLRVYDANGSKIDGSDSFVFSRSFQSITILSSGGPEWYIISDYRL